MRIRIDEVVVNDRLRPLDMVKVAELAESIESVGLLNPISITPDRVLLAGRHRLEAMRLLGKRVIEARVVDLEGLGLELVEIDENLVRAELTALERAEHLQRRRAIYEDMHPETVRPNAGRRPKNVAWAAPFPDDVAAKVGMRPRSVREDLQVAEGIRREARDILRGTPVADMKVELLAICRMDPDVQIRVADKLVKGECRTALQAERLARSEDAAERLAAEPPRRGRRKRNPITDLPHPKLDGTGGRTIYVGDCLEVMASMPDGCVDVVVTSPPYNIGARYDSYEDDRPRADYLEWMGRVSDELRRVLSPHGSLFLEVGQTPSDPWLSHDVASVFREQWTLQNRITWVWSVSVGDETHGQHKPLTSERYLTVTNETIHHFTKGGDVALDRLAVGVPYGVKSNIGRFASQDDLRCRGNTWYVPHEPIQDRHRERGGHPATYPVELASMCIGLHGVARARTVLDPFSGSGSTILAAAELGVTGIGIEIDAGYAAHSVERELRSPPDGGTSGPSRAGRRAR